MSAPVDELLETLTRAAIDDLPRPHASPLLYAMSPDRRRAVVLLALDREPEPWVVAALCEIDEDGVRRPLGQSGDGELLVGAAPEAVEARFGVDPGGTPTDVMTVAGRAVPVNTGGDYFLAVNWDAPGLAPPAPGELPDVNSGGFSRSSADE